MTDLYALLDVEPGANADEIRRAYYRMARLHHPDLHTKGAADEASERFLLIQQAYDILGSPLNRQKYDEETRAQRRTNGDAAPEPERRPARAPSGAKKGARKGAKKHTEPVEKKVSLDDVRKARQAFMRAEEYMDQGHVSKVATLMQAVVRVMDNEPEYLSLFGYALALDGQRLHLARDYCRRASEAEPQNLEFRARLGYVYHRAGLQKTADGIFDEVLAVDEKHPIAKPHHSLGLGGGGGLMGLVNKLLKRS
jgi:curved DNA-binding protein CbpA